MPDPSAINTERRGKRCCSPFVTWPLCHKKPRQPVAQLPSVFCISPKARRCIRLLVQYGLLGFVLLIIILWLGAEFEEYHVRNAPDTLKFYQQSQVCGIVEHSTYEILESSTTSEVDENTTATEVNGRSSALNTTAEEETEDVNVTILDQRLEIRTFSSEEDAFAFETSIDESSASSSSSSSNTPTTRDSPSAKTTTKSVTIAHCGDCGSCSTPPDIKIYDDTKNTLLAASTNCAKRGLIWGRKTASKCLEESVGFSSRCNDCWVDNIMCDLRKCVFTCIWYGLFNQLESNKDSQSLNKCTYCDEKRCGPNFVRCAGANRRRSGILSDIERDMDQEVCTAVEYGWWKDEELQQLWAEQQEESEQEAAAAAAASPAHRQWLR